jgi:hypothetical protein
VDEVPRRMDDVGGAFATNLARFMEIALASA